MSHPDGSDDESNRGQVSRRDVVTLVAGLGIGAGGTLLGYRVTADDAEPSDESSVEWDREEDVVVVGYGAAGAAAAIEAAEADANVVVLEGTEEGGGAVTESYGLMYFGGGEEGTDLQALLGSFDTADRMKRYLKLRNPQAEEARIDNFVDNNLDHYSWVKDLGVEIYSEDSDTRIDERIQYPEAETGLMFTGSEESQPYVGEELPILRGHKIIGEGKTGNKLFEAMDEAATDAGAEVLYETTAERLVTDDDGSVVGVVASQGEEEEIAVRASGSVVLATGPFEMNDEMIRSHAPKAVKGAGGYSMMPIHDGAGTQMAQSVGASVENMSQVTASAYIHPKHIVNDGDMNEHILKGYLINGDGQRFVNEAAAAHDIGTEILLNQNGTAYYVINQQIVEQCGGQPEHLNQEFRVNNLTSLISTFSREYDMDDNQINDSYGIYNYGAESGQDLVHNKPRKYLQPVWNGPFYVYDMGIDSLDIRYRTHGGISTDVDGQVTDIQGESIEGLRAAPRAANTISGAHYEGGLALTESTYFGRLAGEAAAGDVETDEETSS